MNTVHFTKYFFLRDKLSKVSINKNFKNDIKKFNESLLYPIGNKYVRIMGMGTTIIAIAAENDLFPIR